MNTIMVKQMEDDEIEVTADVAICEWCGERILPMDYVVNNGYSYHHWCAKEAVKYGNA